MAAGYERELIAGVTAVRRSAYACRSIQPRLDASDAFQKADSTPVTAADLASQAVAVTTLAELMPGDRVVAEEDARDLRTEACAALRRVVVEHASGALGRALGEDEVLDAIDKGKAEPSAVRYWTLDPLDGTAGFLRGGQYAVALALIDAGQVVVGVLGCPMLDDGVLFAAVRGCGATVQPLWHDAGPVRIQVSDTVNPALARFCESVESSHSNHAAAAGIAGRLGITSTPIRMDGSGKYAMVARGDADIYFRLPTRADYRERIWDHAAGVICVEEAGGHVTDVDGHPLDFTRGRTLAANRGIVATNGRLHEQVLRAVRQDRGEGGRGGEEGLG
jgi:3'(2'), 5'-bisphosphate nucleotidase